MKLKDSIYPINSNLQLIPLPLQFQKLSFHPLTKLDTKTFNDFQIHPETPKTLEEFQANAMEAIENLAKLHALVYQDYLRDQPIRL